MTQIAGTLEADARIYDMLAIACEYLEYNPVGRVVLYYCIERTVLHRIIV